MSPERHHWKPAVQAATVMLRTPAVDGQTPASQPRPLAVYGAQCWECLHHLLVTNQQLARTPRKLGSALCCHSNATGTLIANPPNSAQLGDSLYRAPSYIRVRAVAWAYGRGQTHRRAWPQYILRRLRLTQNVMNLKCISQYCSYFNISVFVSCKMLSTFIIVLVFKIQFP